MIYPSRCHLRIYENVRTRGYQTHVVVVASWSADDPEGGTSIVNRAENLATEIHALQRARHKGRGNREQIDTFVWYEHMTGSETSPDTWDEVRFETAPDGKFVSPRWKSVGKAGVESVVGESLPEYRPPHEVQ